MDSSVKNVVSTFIKKSTIDSKTESNQLSMGRAVEKEHQDVYDLLSKAFDNAGIKMPVTEDDFYEMIAKAHLREFDDYYTRLKKMESGAEKQALDFSSIGPLLKTEEPLDPRETNRAIRLSISAEHDAVHLYELIADSCENADVKELLQDIADEEKVHAHELQIMLNILDSGEEKAKEDAEKEVKDIID